MLIQRLSGGWSPHGDSVASGSTGSQKDQGCLSMAELWGIRVGKPRAEIELSRGFSARGYLKPWSEAQSGHTALWAGTRRAADLGRLTFLHQQEQCGSAWQESTGFGDSKWGCAPETEMLGHRLGELKVWPEIRETGKIDCFSLRAHWRAEPLKLSIPLGLEIRGRHFHSRALKLYGKHSGKESSREWTQADYLAWTLTRVL